MFRLTCLAVSSGARIQSCLHSSYSASPFIVGHVANLTAGENISCILAGGCFAMNSYFIVFFAAHILFPFASDCALVFNGVIALRCRCVRVSFDMLVCLVNCNCRMMHRDALRFCRFQRPLQHALIYSLGSESNSSSSSDDICSVALIVVGAGEQLPKSAAQWKTLPIGQSELLRCLFLNALT